MRFAQLISNKDGKLSTTGFIQFFSWLVVTGLLIYAVYENKPYVEDWFLFYGGFFVFGSPATKGMISVFREPKKKKGE